MTLQLSAATTTTVIYLYQVSGVHPNPSCPFDVPDNVGGKYYKFIDPKIQVVVVRSRCGWFWRNCFRDFYFCLLFFALVSVVRKLFRTFIRGAALRDFRRCLGGICSGERRRYVVVRRLLAGPSGETHKQVSTYLRMLVSEVVGPKP